MAATPTRVLVLTNMYPPHHYGGYELSCRDVVERWRARGVHVEVLTTRMRVPGAQEPEGERAAGTFRELDWYWDDHVLTSPPLWRRTRVERRNQRALARAIGHAQPDVVSIWNMGAMSLGLLTSLAAARLPLVYVVCDDWLIYGPDLDAWTRGFRSRRAVGRVIAAVTRLPTTVPDLGSTATACFVSETTRRRAMEHSGWRFVDSTVVYSGIDRTDFPPTAPADRPWRGRLLYVGRVDERKGIETAIRAMARLAPPAVLEIIGKGDDAHLTRLHELVVASGVEDRVSFSTATRAELAERYRAADALIFPSTWTEPFGLVPIEAMACATPVLATGGGGSSEFLVDGTNCLEFRAGDDEALAASVQRLAADSSLRRHLVEHGLRTADELTVDRLADVLEAWHVAAATGFAGGRPADREPPGAGATHRSPGTSV